MSFVCAHASVYHEGQATDALAKVARYINQSGTNQHQQSARDVTGTGSLLRTYMLGTISTLSDMLQDLQMRRSLDVKKNILKGLASFIQQIGPQISNVGPQVRLSISILRSNVS